MAGLDRRAGSAQPHEALVSLPKPLAPMAEGVLPGATFSL